MAGQHCVLPRYTPAPMPAQPAISVNGLRKVYRAHKKAPGLWGSVRSLFFRKYEEVVAVDDISFDVAEGELVGFLGPNGAGKTTALKMLSGLLHPSGGKATVLGYTPFERKYPFLREISLVMGQKNQLWWDLPAYDSFLLNIELYRLDSEKARKRIDELAEWLEVTDKLRVQVRKLSLGERMKLELIAALLHEPRVIFLDEPTIGLDVVSQRRIRAFIRDYSQRGNTTILLTSHYMADISELCRRVVVIGKGRLLYDGELSALVRQHSGHKIIRLDFPEGAMPPREKLEAIGHVEAYEPPRVRVRVARENVPSATAALLAFEPQDVGVDEVPVEEVVEELFQRTGAASGRNAPAVPTVAGGAP
jgi:ABC-2 type transport system ATP-binding protein